MCLNTVNSMFEPCCCTSQDKQNHMSQCNTDYIILVCLQCFYCSASIIGVQTNGNMEVIQDIFHWSAVQTATVTQHSPDASLHK